MLIKNEFNFKRNITDHYGHEKKLALFEIFKYIQQVLYTFAAIRKYLLKGQRIESNKLMGIRLFKGKVVVTFETGQPKTRSRGITDRIAIMR